LLPVRPVFSHSLFHCTRSPLAKILPRQHGNYAASGLGGIILAPRAVISAQLCAHLLMSWLFFREFPRLFSFWEPWKSSTFQHIDHSSRRRSPLFFSFPPSLSQFRSNPLLSRFVQRGGSPPLGLFAEMLLDFARVISFWWPFGRDIPVCPPLFLVPCFLLFLGDFISLKVISLCSICCGDQSPLFRQVKSSLPKT